VKRIAILLAVLAAGTSVIAAATGGIPADTVRGAVENEIRAATGFEPLLRGPVSVSMFPVPTVALSDVVLNEPDGGDVALAAEHLTANLRLVPLLAGRVEIADVALTKSRIAVTVHPDGRTNWSPLIDNLARALRPGAADGDKVLSFSEVDIRDGAVALRIPGQGVDETLEGVELSLAWPAIAGSFAATGHFTWNRELVDTSLFIANFPGALAGDDSGLKFRARTGQLKAAFDGVMSYRPTLKVDGTLAADTASLRDALVWAGGRSLPSGGLGQFALKAHAAVTGKAISLSDLNVELDGNVAEGVLSYATAGRQSFQGTLAVENLDLSPYVSTFSLIADTTHDWDRRALVLEWFNGWEADVRLSAARVQLANAELGRTAVAASMRAGRLVVTVGEAQAFDGVVTGNVAVARSEAGADFSSQMQFAGVNLQQCLGQVFGVNQLDGSGRLGFSVTSRGHDVRELAGNLTGTLQIAATEGGLNGLNVEQMMQRLQRSPFSATGNIRSGRTPFDTLNIGLRIVDGLATIDDVALEGPSVRLAVTGTTSIPERELNLAGAAHLISATSDPAPLLELPFTVRGPWTNPSIVPDMRALIDKSPGMRPLLESLDRNQDRNARDDAQDAVNRLMKSIGPRSR
jgi:AsmA protein